MIPAYLEKLVHEGKAKIKTYCGGIGQVLGFKIPEHCYGILFHMQYFPHYASPDVQIDSPLSKLDERQVQTIFVRSGKNNSHFACRTMRAIVSDGGGTNYPTFMETNFPMYMVCEDEVKITLGDVSPCFTWAIDFSPLPDLANEEKPPVGAGTVSIGGLNVARAVDVLPANPFTVAPPSRTRNKPIQTFANEFIIPVEQAVNPVVSSHNVCYPIINILYAEIQGKPKSL